VRNQLWWIVGLAAGAANTVRHRARGYRTPRRFSNTDYGKAAAYDEKVVNRWQDRSGFENWCGLRILEVGPGPDLGTGAILLSRGAECYLAVDLFPLAAAVPAEFYRRWGVDAAYLGYQQVKFPSLPQVGGQHDVVVSNATLEHVEDVDGLFRRLAELVPAGGRMIHHVDAKAHMRPFDQRDPLGLHRYSERLYRALLHFPGAPNRLLANDYVLAADRAGFDVDVVPGRVADSTYLRHVRLAPQFANRQDLNLLSFTLVAVRRA
jgi:SAM-dependent methyltransferase